MDAFLDELFAEQETLSTGADSPFSSYFAEPLPVLIRQNAVSLDDVDPHWTHYNDDAELLNLATEKPCTIILPRGNYVLRSGRISRAVIRLTY